MNRYQAWVVLIAALTMSIASLAISLRANHASEERERAARLASEQAWCVVLVTLDDAYRIPGQEPETEAGKNVAAAISDLRKRNCPPADPSRPLPSITKSK